MDVYRTEKDDDGNVLLDEDGNFVKDELFALFVMRKERGFGAKYGEQRNGEWEYAAYRPDGSVLVPSENTLACAACHVEASEGKDWVFGADRHFGLETAPEPDENEIVVADYTFVPETLTVEVGSEVKWSSSDVVFHTITASDGSFSGALRPNQSFSQTFEQPGTYEYFSAFYPNVKGTVEVIE
jgi:plastocyanin